MVFILLISMVFNHLINGSSLHFNTYLNRESTTFYAVLVACFTVCSFFKSTTHLNPAQPNLYLLSHTIIFTCDQTPARSLCPLCCGVAYVTFGASIKTYYAVADRVDGIYEGARGRTYGDT